MFVFSLFLSLHVYEMFLFWAQLSWAVVGLCLNLGADLSLHWVPGVCDQTVCGVAPHVLSILGLKSGLQLSLYILRYLQYKTNLTTVHLQIWQLLLIHTIILWMDVMNYYFTGRSFWNRNLSIFLRILIFK